VSAPVVCEKWGTKKDLGWVRRNGGEQPNEERVGRNSLSRGGLSKKRKKLKAGKGAAKGRERL